SRGDDVDGGWVGHTDGRAIADGRHAREPGELLFGERGERIQRVVRRRGCEHHYVGSSLGGEEPGVGRLGPTGAGCRGHDRAREYPDDDGQRQPSLPSRPKLGRETKTNRSHYSALNARPGRRRAATSPGKTATRLATMTVPGTISNSTRIGTSGAGTMPIPRSKTIHAHRPAATPNGTPMAMATRASVVACHATAVLTWRGTNPSVLTIASSRPRRRMDVTSRWPRVAAARPASRPARTRGNPCTRPKFTTSLGLSGATTTYVGPKGAMICERRARAASASTPSPNRTTRVSGLGGAVSDDSESKLLAASMLIDAPSPKPEASLELGIIPRPTTFSDTAPGTPSTFTRTRSPMRAWTWLRVRVPSRISSGPWGS